MLVIVGYFSSLSDPLTKEHKLIHILFITITAAICEIERLKRYTILWGAEIRVAEKHIGTTF